MDDVLHALAATTRLAMVIGGSGAVFAFGVVGICRWLKWAPVNIVVNLNIPADLSVTISRDDDA